MSWDLVQLSVLVIAASAASLVQGVLGFGFALIFVPVVVVVSPLSLPGLPLLLVFPIIVAMYLDHRETLSPSMLWRIVGGRLLGTIFGFVALISVSSETLSLVVGIVLVTGSLVSGVRVWKGPSGLPLFSGGIVAGMTGTTVAVGGVPFALMLQNRPGSELRGALSVSALIGCGFSIVAVRFAGLLRTQDIVLALCLAPIGLVVLYCSRWVRERVDGQALKGTVLASSGLAGTYLVLVAHNP